MDGRIRPSSSVSTRGAPSPASLRSSPMPNARCAISVHLVRVRRSMAVRGGIFAFRSIDFERPPRNAHMRFVPTVAVPIDRASPARAVFLFTGNPCVYRLPARACRETPAPDCRVVAVV